VLPVVVPYGRVDLTIASVRLSSNSREAGAELQQTLLAGAAGLCACMLAMQVDLAAAAAACRVTYAFASVPYGGMLANVA
jgi:hypothetical protein